MYKTNRTIAPARILDVRHHRRTIVLPVIIVYHFFLSQKPTAGLHASAHAVHTDDGRVPENVRRVHAGPEVARVRQLPHAHRTRRSAGAGIRLFRGRPRRRERGEVQRVHRRSGHDVRHDGRAGVRGLRRRDRRDRPDGRARPGLHRDRSERHGGGARPGHYRDRSERHGHRPKMTRPPWRVFGPAAGDRIKRRVRRVRTNSFRVLFLFHTHLPKI